VGARLDPGEGSRLGDLYRQYLPEMVQLAYIVTGDGKVAEDLAQEAFVRMAGRFAHLRNPDAAGFYLRRTLINLCKNYFRHHNTEQVFLRSQVRLDLAQSDATTDTHEVLRVALLGLPDRQRAAIALRYFEDRSVEETALIMGCPQGTVKALTSRGLDALRAVMEPEVDRS
jgi:RNA polymerase sigma factor (sigma-70 family)